MLSDRIRSKCIYNKLEVAPIRDKMIVIQLCWFGHVHHRPICVPYGRIEWLLIVLGALEIDLDRHGWEKDMKVVNLSDGRLLS